MDAICAGASAPCTSTGNTSISVNANRRQATDSTSRTAAPLGEVTTPRRRGKTGSRRLRASSNNPSACSFAFSNSNARRSAPSPASSMCSRINWKLPRGSYRLTRARASTRVPLPGRKRIRAFSRANIAQRTSAEASFNEKYQCPDPARTKLHTSPSIQTIGSASSISPRTKRFSAEGVRTWRAPPATCSTGIIGGVRSRGFAGFACTTVRHMATPVQPSPAHRKTNAEPGGEGTQGPRECERPQRGHRGDREEQYRTAQQRAGFGIAEHAPVLEGGAQGARHAHRADRAAPGAAVAADPVVWRRGHRPRTLPRQHDFGGVLEVAKVLL